MAGIRRNLELTLITRLARAGGRRAVRQTFWMGAIMALQILGGLAQVVISTRILGPEGYGVLAVIIAATMLAHGALSAPGGEAVTAFVTRETSRGRGDAAGQIVRFVLAASVGMSLAAYGLVAGLAWAAGGLLGVDGAYIDAVLIYGVVGILLATQGESLAILRLADRLPLGVAVTVAATLTRIGLLGAAWWAGGGLNEVILAHLGGAAVSGVGLLAVAALSARQAGIRGLLSSASLRAPADVVRFQFGAFGKSTIWALTHNMDSLLMAQFTGAAEVGLYRGARQIVDTARYPFQPLMDVAQPDYSRQWYGGQRGQLRRTALRYALASGILALVVFGALAALYQWATGLVLGAAFEGSELLLLMMIPGSFIATGVSVLTALPAAAGRVWPSLAGALAGLAVAAVLIVWLTPEYGAAGGALANSAYFAVFVAVVMPCVLVILRQREDGPRGRIRHRTESDAHP